VIELELQNVSTKLTLRNPKGHFLPFFSILSELFKSSQLQPAFERYFLNFSKFCELEVKSIKNA